MTDFSRNWMWSEACDMLVRAERLHRQFFQPSEGKRVPAWEPPVDVLETEREVLVLVALPSVDLDQVEVAIDVSDLVIRGQRLLPPELRTAIIHRLELPQGRFERRLRLPAGIFGAIRRGTAFGCLTISLEKL